MIYIHHAYVYIYVYLYTYYIYTIHVYVCIYIYICALNHCMYIIHKVYLASLLHIPSTGKAFPR